MHPAELYPQHPNDFSGGSPDEKISPPGDESRLFPIPYSLLSSQTPMKFHLTTKDENLVCLRVSASPVSPRLFSD